MVLGLVLHFVVRFTFASGNASASPIAFLLLSVLSSILWVWGCCHLAKHLGLHPAWGLWGLLFIIGVCVIFWASKQQPKWDRAAARQPKRREYRGDPKSPY